MAYTKFIDGSRAFTAAATNDITFQQANEIQDQSRRIIGPRDVCLFPNGFQHGAVGESWTAGGGLYEFSNGYLTTTVDDAVWEVPIIAKENSIIHSVEVVVGGTTNVTNGLIKLRQYARGSAAALRDLDITNGTAHPWDTGVPGGPIWNATVQIYRLGYNDSAYIPMIMTGDHHYCLYFQSPDNTNATGSVEIWWYSVVISSSDGFHTT